MPWVYKGGDIGLMWEDDGTNPPVNLTGGADTFISPVNAGVSTSQNVAQTAATMPSQSTIGNPAPWKPSAWQYTPAQLGWSQQEAARFASAGITKLPEYMNKESLYGPGKSLSSDDPIQTFIDIYKSPIGNSGKDKGALVNLYGALGNDFDVNSEEGKQAYTEWLLNDKWGTNVGTWKQSVLPAMQGIGSILAPIAGLGAAGAFAAPVAAGGAAGGGTAAAGSGGGGLFGTTAGLGATGGTGIYGTGLGLEGGGLGGLYGTGVGGASFSLSDLGVTGGMAAGGASGVGGAGENAAGYSISPVGSGQGGMFGTPSTISTPEGSGGLFGTGSTISNPSGAGGLFGTGVGNTTGAAAAGGGGMGIWDSLTDYFGGSSSGGGTDWSSVLKSLIGVGGAVAGGVMGNNAIQDSLDKMMKYNQPFYDLGVSNIPALNAADPTGGASQYTDLLKNYGTNFKFDANNPAYTQQLAESTRLNDQNLAARGMYNSRAGLNLQDQSARNLTATEYDKQYARGYGNLVDLYNQTSQTGGTNYSKLLDMVKIGSGASGSAGQGALASGQSTANLYSGLGAMPMNYMVLQQMLSGGGA